MDNIIKCANCKCDTQYTENEDQDVAVCDDCFKKGYGVG